MEGEILKSESSLDEILVVIEAAKEKLLLIRAESSLELMTAAYHLGNRHVELELHSKELYLLDDPVLEEMLLKRGLSVKKLIKPFYPELGAYHHSHR